MPGSGLTAGPAVVRVFSRSSDMSLRHWSVVAVTVLVAAGGFALQAATAPEPVPQASQRVFELRIYHAAPGKFEALKARFRDHVLDLFAKHGLEAIGGYYTPSEGPDVGNTIIYVLVHESREAADRNWGAFAADPVWVKAKADSEADGPLTTSVTREWLSPTDFSPVQ
jgi:hypothetical protein